VCAVSLPSVKEAHGVDSYFELVFDLPLTRRFAYRADAKGLAAVGKRAVVSFGRREMTGFIVGTCSEKPADIDEAAIKPIRRVVDKEPIFSESEIGLAQWIAGFYLCSEGEAIAAMLPSGRRAKELPEFGVDEDAISRAKLTLSPEQETALGAIVQARWNEGTFYLYGITGSGKTEVFLRAAEHFLAQGQSVIYLVPEIALSRQTAEDIKARFGPVACTLHSALPGSEKLVFWQKIRAGEVKIVVGPRSAVFAPVVNLGLVIIDEEHDGSYKSGNTPRYHARQVAMKRAALAKAVLVMGSATPSAESWQSMKDGAIKKLPLTRRLAGGAVPHISTVNLEGVEGCLSPALRYEIEKTVAMHRQTILFLNRRGFAYFYHCHSCGYELKCKHCSVSLTYHKSIGKAVCHYCGYKTPIPDSCPQCGSLDAGFAGFGTELVEETVRRTFPDLRIDRDEADNIDDVEHTLACNKAGHIDILLGTQIVAKGLNFPGVRLVGVILADTALHLPDFRARERTFSLLVQVAGRAGRYFPDGKVLVQTLRPDDSAISCAVQLDVDGFFDAELAARQEQGFPPFSRLVRFVIRSRDLARAEKAADKLLSIIRRLAPKDAEILGPAPCPIALHADNHRVQLTIRAAAMPSIHAAAAKAFAAFNADRDPKVYLEADVDPVSLL
jgi:primosomal protein N' (replication factor Y)